jgi:hypothetical protein
MGLRGKKSTAELSVVQPDGITAIRRPEPPEDLTEDQAYEWRCIVNRMPADWFPRETHPMLAQYCRHAVAAARIAKMVADFECSASDDENWLNTYDKLLKMQEREGRALSSLATRMRISQQGQYNHKKKTGSAIAHKRPWE